MAFKVKGPGKVPKVAVSTPKNPNTAFNNPARHVSRPPRIQAIATRDYGKVNQDVNPADPSAPLQVPPGGGFGSTGLGS